MCFLRNLPKNPQINLQKKLKILVMARLATKKVGARSVCKFLLANPYAIFRISKLLHVNVAPYGCMHDIYSTFPISNTNTPHFLHPATISTDQTFLVSKKSKFLLFVSLPKVKLWIDSHGN